MVTYCTAYGYFLHWSMVTFCTGYGYFWYCLSDGINVDYSYP